MYRRNILAIIALCLLIALSINSIIDAQEIEVTAEATVEAPAQAPTEIPTEIPTESPTEIPTEIPTEAPTATEAPTLEATVEVTSEATSEIPPEATAEATSEITSTPEVTASPTPESTLTQIIESENAAVTQAGTWTQYLNEAASGGSFIASSGSTGDILTLTFSGSSLEIIYVQSAILGTFAIEIDGAVVQTINANSTDMLLGVRAAVSGLSEGTHTVRIVPLEGVVAIDAFALESTATVISSEATETPTPEVTEVAGELAAMTFVVTNTADSGAGSLRQAMLNANANPGVDTITFNIPGSGVQTIQPTTPLPTITSGVIINGYSQPGSAPAVGSTAATLLIEIDGQLAGVSFGLLIQSSGSTIKGLVINRFNLDAIFLSGNNAKNNRIEGNHIGVNATGLNSAGNNASGIAIGDGASNNIIGGTTPAARNVISGINGPGVQIYNNSKNNRVQGNYIGTDANGLMIIGNTGNGVLIGSMTSTGNLIGGTTAGARNIISGNGENGVGLAGTTSNLIQGNYIGTDVTGVTDAGNFSAGVAIDNASSNTIGGTSAGAGNVISGNDDSGIALYNASRRNVIQHNIIGLMFSADAPLGNTGDGITLADPGTTSNTIGGTTASARNIISGNNVNGVAFYNSATANTVQGNYIGTDITGGFDLGNLANGVHFDSAPNNMISRNVISGNDYNGIMVIASSGDASRNKIQGNYIGTNAAGTTAIPNAEDGVHVEDISNMVIGGTTSAARNIISGNGFSGIFICHCAGGITIQGNYIGTDVTGNLPVSNGILSGGFGIEILDSPNNIVGGTASGARNIISGNGKLGEIGGGISISGPDAQGNTVLGNYIGTNAKGNARLANLGAGVELSDGASNNTIGGTKTGSRNIISGNGDEGNSVYGPGIQIHSSLAGYNHVQGNYIGINAAGTAALPNSVGVLINEGSNTNLIGGTTASARNVISGNIYAGVSIGDEGSSNNLVQGNFIGTNAAGTRALGNGLNGVYIWASASNNLVGGTVSGARNIISGNTTSGIAVEGHVDDPGTQTRANTNTIQGNYIGLDVTGNVDLGNGFDGITLYNQTFGNLIGGTVPSARNVISGDAFYSISIFGPNNTVQGNYIGINAAGTRAIDGGIYMENAANNLIGGTVSGARNIISGNQGNGIFMTGVGSTGNLIQGNYIGTNPSGNSRLGNTSDGIWLYGGAANNTIGGIIPGARNIISGNGNNGISVTEANTSNNLIQGNYIGTNVTGSIDLGNTSDGVMIGSGATSNTVGGTVLGARNIISGNNSSGVNINGVTTSSNLVQGNYVGTNAAGTGDLGNSYDGIFIAGSAANNTIGGSAVGAGNLISGNGSPSQGVGNGVGLYTDVTGTTIQGNRIGTNAAGTAGIPNGDSGVVLYYNIDNNLVGGTNAGEGNTIAYNKNSGIRVFTDDSAGNQFLGNSIYSNGRLGISLYFTGLTPLLNDEDDGDTGANDAQNYPILNAITLTQVSGSLNSTPGTDFRIEFFSSPVCDPTGFGEGQTFLGSTNVTTNGMGDASITFNGAFTTSTIITATATDLTSNDTSEFSPCLLLTTAAVTKTPMLISPANNAFVNDNTTVFSWGAVPNASNYQIEVATANTFATIIFTATSPARTVETTAVLNDQPYWWHVRAINSAGTPGPYSAPRMFTVDTLAPTESPALISPADNGFTSDLTPTFTWSKMTGAKRYRISISTTSDCLTPIIQLPVVTPTSYTLPSDPGIGEGTYYWCVQGDDAAGNWGPLSASRRLYITLLRIPLNGTDTTDTTPTFTWSRAPGSNVKYQLIINDTADMNTPVYQSSLLTATSFTLPNGDALTPGTYYWTIVVTGGSWPVFDQVYWSFAITVN